MAARKFPPAPQIVLARQVVVGDQIYLGPPNNGAWPVLRPMLVKRLSSWGASVVLTVQSTEGHVTVSLLPLDPVIIAPRAVPAPVLHLYHCPMCPEGLLHAAEQRRIYCSRAHQWQANNAARRARQLKETTPCTSD